MSALLGFLVIVHTDGSESYIYNRTEAEARAAVVEHQESRGVVHAAWHPQSISIVPWKTNAKVKRTLAPARDPSRRLGFVCPQCGTESDESGECDWCPTAKKVPT
jgi:hypothetical protein